MRLAAALAALLVLGGCVHLYPSWMDDTAVKEAAVDYFRDANKTYGVRGKVHNPEVEFYFKQSFGARAIGVESDFDLTTSGGPTPQTKP